MPRFVGRCRVRPGRRRQLVRCVTFVGLGQVDHAAGFAAQASAAFLFAHPTRARLCQLLLDGRFHTAGELARAGGVSASTASAHLALLLDAGILEAARQGRHRYFRLDSPPAAAALEALGLLAPPDPSAATLRSSRVDAALQSGRTCYDHLAGRLGVQITAGLISAAVLTAVLAARDLTSLGPLQLQVETGSRSPLARGCMDWTERTHHLAGRLAAALLHRLLERGPRPRAPWSGVPTGAHARRPTRVVKHGPRRHGTHIGSPRGSRHDSTASSAGKVVRPLVEESARNDRLVDVAVMTCPVEHRVGRVRIATQK